jgi:uncharacterized membrane protein (UPF0127 family)
VRLLKFFSFILIALFQVVVHAKLGNSPKYATYDGIQFRRTVISVAGHPIRAEIADNFERREHGLMNRKSLKDGEGMLFVFDSEQELNFWMKNTLIPLSIGFFDKHKKLIDIQEMEPASMAEQNPKTYPSAHPAQYALEMPKGWFHKNKVETGASLKLSAAE